MLSVNMASGLVDTAIKKHTHTHTRQTGAEREREVGEWEGSIASWVDGVQFT